MPWLVRSDCHRCFAVKPVSQRCGESAKTVTSVRSETGFRDAVASPSRLSPVFAVIPVSQRCGESVQTVTVTAIKPVSQRLCGMSFKALSPVFAVKPVSQRCRGESVKTATGVRSKTRF